MTVNQWTRTSMEMPPVNVPVIVMNGDIEQELVWDGRLWWFPDKSMYVYFTPRLWRHA